MSALEKLIQLLPFGTDAAHNVSLNSNKKASTVSTEYFSAQGKKAERVVILP